MKKALPFLAIAAAIIFGACDFSVSVTPIRSTRLTIRNESIYELDYVQWNGTSFGEDPVYDVDLKRYVQDGIARNSESTQWVDAGSSYVTFYFTHANQRMRTKDPLYVPSGGNITFIFRTDTSYVAEGIVPKAASSGDPSTVVISLRDAVVVEDGAGKP